MHSENVKLSNLVNPFKIVTLVNILHPLKEFLPIFITDDGIVNSLNELHFSNEHFPISVIVGDNIIFRMNAHPEYALSPIILIVEGIVISDNRLQFLNALFPIQTSGWVNKRLTISILFLYAARFITVEWINYYKILFKVINGNIISKLYWKLHFLKR